MIFRPNKERRLKRNIESGKYLKKMSARLSKALQNNVIDNKTKKTISFAKELISAGDLRPLSLLIQAVNSSNIFYDELREYFHGLGELFFDFHKALIQKDKSNLQSIVTWLSFYIASDKLNEFSNYLNEINVDAYTAAQILTILLQNEKETEALAWIRRLRTSDVLSSKTKEALDYESVKAMLQIENASKVILDQLEKKFEEEEYDNKARNLLERLISDGMRKDIAQNYVQEIRKGDKLSKIDLNDTTQRIFKFLKWTRSTKAEDWTEFNVAIRKSDFDIEKASELLSGMPPEEIEFETFGHLIRRCFEDYITIHNKYSRLELLDKIVNKSKIAGYSYKFYSKETKCYDCNGTGTVGANYEAAFDKDTHPGYICATCKGDGGRREFKITMTSIEGKFFDYEEKTSYQYELTSKELNDIFKG